MSELSISVIIPAYNAEAYLPDAVASVRAQQGVTIKEIIVIDDGSSDGTASCAESLQCKVFRKERGGAGAARNLGVEAATGELVHFLDADDVLAEGALAALTEPFYVDEKMAAVFGKAVDFISPELSEEQQNQLTARTEAYGGILPGCSVLRRSVFDEIGLFDTSLRSAETVAWMMKLREAGLATTEIPMVTLRRRIHMTNTGRVNRLQEMRNYAAVLRNRMKKHE